MSQVDDAILDALTHVSFPKGFAQAKPSSVVTIDNVNYPVCLAGRCAGRWHRCRWAACGGRTSTSRAKRIVGDSGPLYGDFCLFWFG